MLKYSIERRPLIVFTLFALADLIHRASRGAGAMNPAFGALPFLFER